MSRFSRANGPAALAIAVLALVVALAGTSYAAVTLGKNSVDKVHIKKDAVDKGQIRKDAVGKSEIRDDAVGAREIKNGTLRYENFAAGEVAATSWAVVGENGSLDRGHGVDEANRIDAGQYQVVFNKDVTQCAFTGTIGASNAGATVAVIGTSGAPNSLDVATSDASGAAADARFHLVVTC